MPVIRRWRSERMVEDMEELFGAEMQPYLSNCLEEEMIDEQENQLKEPAPESTLTKTNPNPKFWSKLTTLFHSENW